MTIDEQGRVIHEQLPATVTPSLLENTEMRNSVLAMIANSLVEASDVMARIAAIEEELKRLTDALAVANDQAAVAIRERDAALSSRDAALRREEIANSAYDTVNAARIQADSEAHELRQDRMRLQDDLAATAYDLEDAHKKIADLEAHITRLNTDHDALQDEKDKNEKFLRDKARDFEDLYNVALEDTKRLEAERGEAMARAINAENAKYNTEADLNRARTSLAEIRAIVGDR